jgi:23S rRNA (cytosine1962-C5)-methyltransferase
MRSITLRPEAHRRLLAGHPWIYSNEVVMDATAKALQPGSLVRLLRADGAALALGFFNPHTLIAARVLTRRLDATIDVGFFAKRLESARALRDRLYARPFYRLVHAEADGFPGTVIDRFDDHLVAQINCAGMELLLPEILEALERVLRPAAVLLRADSPARTQEGLSDYVKPAKGEIDSPVELEENGVRYLADLSRGQKTGWFFDQRENRAAVARSAKGSALLDAYAYAGGFGLAAAVAGASAVTMLDRSDSALALAEKAAQLNGVMPRCELRRAEAFEELGHLAELGRSFGVVVADPPAFVKSKKELKQGARGYRKLARLAAAIVEPGGFLFIASCSHNMPAEEFERQIARGLIDVGREGRILSAAGAAPDHPVHPALPESAYLKTLLLQID